MPPASATAIKMAISAIATKIAAPAKTHLGFANTALPKSPQRAGIGTEIADIVESSAPTVIPDLERNWRTHAHLTRL